MSKSIPSNTEKLKVISNILDNLSVPIAVGTACYNGNGDIEDIKIVYMNKAFLDETKEFVKIGDSYHSLQKLLPSPTNWLAICINALTTGETYEDNYYSEKTDKWYHMIVHKCGKSCCSFTLVNLNKSRLNQYNLTNRQLIIARKIIERKKYATIADEVYISTALIKKECKEIFTKTKVTSKNEFILKFK